VTVPIKKAGAYQLRMSLRDTSSERIGAASQFIEAPDLKKDRLALSGIVIRGDSPAARTDSIQPPPFARREPAGKLGAGPESGKPRPGQSGS